MIADFEKMSNWFDGKQPEWINYALGCIDAEMCPICGRIIFIPENISATNEIGLIFVECSRCDWYIYV